MLTSIKPEQECSVGLEDDGWI